jgi:hypothetical protein
MSIITAYSVKEDTNDAIDDIRAQFQDFSPGVVLFFSSPRHDPALISGKMQESFPEATTFGCTSSGEIITGQVLKGAVVAMGFSREMIPDMRVQVIENVSTDIGVAEALRDLENHFDTPAFEMDFEKYVGIILIDGLSGAEEQLMDDIGDLTNVLFVGASAGDDLKFEKTHVFANGRAYSNAALLALLKPAVPFGLIKTQSFSTKNVRLVATKVNEAEREVYEFNNKPAAVAYAEALNTSIEEAQNKFMTNPLGLMVEGEPYVRSPQRIRGRNMLFYCNVLQGMELDVLESNDIVADTRTAVAEKEAEMGGISAIINFNCILRTLQLEQSGQVRAYGEIFKNIPTIGFSTYGEEYIGHLNQTATMLVFK